MDLQNIRQEIDRIDAELTRLFAERMALSGQVAAYKKANGLPIYDPRRERDKLAEIESALPAELAGCGTALYATIFALSREQQSRILGTKPENLILIGMPGCGKNTLTRLIAERLGRPGVSSDALVEGMTGMTIPEIFEKWGEDTFRALETQALSLLCQRQGSVIATGGGCVTRPENRALLRENGLVVWIQRDLHLLPTAGRPLSESRGVEALYAEREAQYRACADVAVENNGTVEEAVGRILSALQEKRKR